MDDVAARGVSIIVFDLIADVDDVTVADAVDGNRPSVAP